MDGSLLVAMQFDYLCPGEGSTWSIHHLRKKRRERSDRSGRGEREVIEVICSKVPIRDAVNAAVGSIPV